MEFFTCGKCNGSGRDDYYNEAVNTEINLHCRCQKGLEDQCFHPESKNLCKRMFDREGFYLCAECSGTGKISWIQRVFSKGT